MQQEIERQEQKARDVRAGRGGKKGLHLMNIPDARFKSRCCFQNTAVWNDSYHEMEEGRSERRGRIRKWEEEEE